MRIHKESEDPRYWEKILEFHGLGERQSGLQEEPQETGDGALEEIDIAKKKPNGQKSRDMQKLRHKMDGDDNFMGAHQIKKIRTREREIPVWTLSNEEVQKVLLLAFPCLNTRKASRKAAGRWARIIHLYYRMQMSNSLVAKEIGVSLSTLYSSLRRIRRVAQGKLGDGKSRSLRPRGRP